MSGPNSCTGATALNTSVAWAAARFLRPKIWIRFQFTTTKKTNLRRRSLAVSLARVAVLSMASDPSNR